MPLGNVGEQRSRGGSRQDRHVFRNDRPDRVLELIVGQRTVMVREELFLGQMYPWIHIGNIGAIDIVRCLDRDYAAFAENAAPTTANVAIIINIRISVVSFVRTRRAAAGDHENPMRQFLPKVQRLNRNLRPESRCAALLHALASWQLPVTSDLGAVVSVVPHP